LIQPYKWNFILIPNLPHELLNIVESPVPYLTGVLGGDVLKRQFLFNREVKSNILHLKAEKQIEICVRVIFNYYIIYNIIMLVPRKERVQRSLLKQFKEVS